MTKIYYKNGKVYGEFRYKDGKLNGVAKIKFVDFAAFFCEKRKTLQVFVIDNVVNDRRNGVRERFYSSF